MPDQIVGQIAGNSSKVPDVAQVVNGRGKAKLLMPSFSWRFLFRGKSFLIP